MWISKVYQPTRGKRFLISKSINLYLSFTSSWTFLPIIWLYITIENSSCFIQFNLNWRFSFLVIHRLHDGWSWVCGGIPLGRKNENNEESLPELRNWKGCTDSWRDYLPRFVILLKILYQIWRIQNTIESEWDFRRYTENYLGLPPSRQWISRYYYLLIHENNIWLK